MQCHTFLSQSGSATCFRHGAPCGGQNASTGPFETYTGGQQVFIKWLQNFNHYEIGFPGSIFHAYDVYLFIVVFFLAKSCKCLISHL